MKKKYDERLQQFWNHNLNPVTGWEKIKTRLAPPYKIEAYIRKLQPKNRFTNFNR